MSKSEEKSKLQNRTVFMFKYSNIKNWNSFPKRNYWQNMKKYITEIDKNDKILYSKVFILFASLKQETLFWTDKKQQLSVKNE